MGIKVTPTVLVYRRGARGVELAGQNAGPKDDAAIAEWLERPEPVVAATTATDPALVQANFQVSSQAQPSSQGYSQPQAPPMAPPMQPMAPPAPDDDGTRGAGLCRARLASGHGLGARPDLPLPAAGADHRRQPAGRSERRVRPSRNGAGPDPEHLHGTATRPTPMMASGPPIAPAAPLMFAAPAPVPAQSPVGTAVVGLLLENPSFFTSVARQLWTIPVAFRQPDGADDKHTANHPDAAFDDEFGPATANLLRSPGCAGSRAAGRAPAEPPGGPAPEAWVVPPQLNALAGKPIERAVRTSVPGRPDRVASQDVGAGVGSPGGPGTGGVGGAGSARPKGPGPSTAGSGYKFSRGAGRAGTNR